MTGPKDCPRERMWALVQQLYTAAEDRHDEPGTEDVARLASALCDFETAIGFDDPGNHFQPAGRA